MLVILTSTVQAYSISGNIKDDTANRLPGVTISSNSFTDVVQSDANGHFVMSRDYPIGTYEFTASKVGYTIELIQVRVVGYDVTNADSILTKVTSVPTSTTLTATSITSTSATLRGEVNPNGLSTTIDFASSTSFGQPGYFASTASQNIGSGSYIVSVSASLTDLTPNTVYSYAVRASNSKGFKNGAIVSFTTLPVADNGILKIKSNVNAIAYVDNVLAGNTNFNDYLTYLTTAGTHTVTISQTGYITWSSSVNVKSDKSSNPYTYIDANLISNDPTLPQTTLPKDPLKPMTIVTPTQPDAGDGPALDLCAIFGLFCPQTTATPIPYDSTPDCGLN